MSNPLTATTAITIRTLSNDELAAANNAIQEFGRVPKENIAHEKLVKLKIIKDNGNPWDAESTQDAFAYEVNRRVKAGTFN